jgi:hypothetical protein
MRIGSFARSALALGIFAVGCSSDDSMTTLRPDGPPEVLQVFLMEDVDDGMGNISPQMNLAFGLHQDTCSPDAGGRLPEENPFCYEVGDGTVQAASRDAQRIRIVFDELLQGSTVEDFSCACVDSANGCGAGPEATSDPVLCPGDPDVQGKWLDADDNQVPDQAQFKPGVVTISCMDGTTLMFGPTDGYYSPSGNQQVPVALGLGEGLGPSIVLETVGQLPSDTDCTINFNGVTDKSGEAPMYATPFSFHTAI